MEIIRGRLDDISRTASIEGTSSRMSSLSLAHSDRISPTTPFSLVVLTNDAVDMQIQSSSEEAPMSTLVRDPDKGQCWVDVTDDEKGDLELQRAIEEMKRLDEILTQKICQEKETKRQRKELQAQLWQDFLQNKPEGHSECAYEALNTRLFLALEASTDGTQEEDDYAPVFATQLPECEHNRNQNLEPSEKRPNSSTELFEVGHEETSGEQFAGSHCGASKGKKKQKDFVKRNIELVSGEGDRDLLTQAERKRLAELLQEIDEEEEDGARGADSEEDIWAGSDLTGQGYTPEPSDLEQLIDIDSKIQFLLPVKEFLSECSSETNLSVPQGHGSEVSWKCDGDPQPGEKVLLDLKVRRGLEWRLEEIQQQLEILGQSQEMTNESPDLTEEQLLGLLDGCEMTDSCAQDLDTQDTML